MISRPPYDPWLSDLHRAMLIGIADVLKIQYQPPNDLTQELLEVLERLEEKGDTQN